MHWEKGAGLRGSYEQHKKRWQEDGDRPVGLMQFVNGPKPYDTGATGETPEAGESWSGGLAMARATRTPAICVPKLVPIRLKDTTLQLLIEPQSRCAAFESGDTKCVRMPTATGRLAVDRLDDDVAARARRQMLRERLGAARDE